MTTLGILKQSSRSSAVNPRPQFYLTSLNKIRLVRHVSLTLECLTQSFRRKTPSRLPLELIRLIGEHVLGYWPNVTHLLPLESLDDPLRMIQQRPISAQKTLARMAQVSKEWHAMIVSLLYYRPVLSSLASINEFSRGLKASPNMANCIREIFLLKRNTEIFTEPFEKSEHPSTVELRYETQVVLSQVWKCRTMPNPIKMTVLTTTQSPRGEGGSFAAELANWNSSQLSSISFNSAPMSMANIQSLTLDSQITTMSWTDMPLLTTLTIRHCPLIYLSLPSSHQVPNLQVLSIVQVALQMSIPWHIHQPWRNLAQDIRHLAPTLQSLILDGRIYEALIPCYGLPFPFMLLQEIRLTGTEEHPNVRREQTFGLLRVTGNPDNPNVWVAFNITSSRAVLTAVGMQRLQTLRAGLRVNGSEGFGGDDLDTTVFAELTCKTDWTERMV